MKEPNRERVRAAVADLVGIVIFGMLMATVIEALSPENLLRRDAAVPGAVAGMIAPESAGLSLAA